MNMTDPIADMLTRIRNGVQANMETVDVTPVSKVKTEIARILKEEGYIVYAKENSIPKVINGLGIAIISTSNGMMTDREARKQHVGGEVVAYVW